MNAPWPFSRKKTEPQQPEAPRTITYDRSEGGQPSEAVSDRSHIESEDYQAAMAALAVPHLGAERSAVTAETAAEWVQNSDGYWYRKQPDGSYDAIPHTKGADGEFEAYASN